MAIKVGEVVGREAVPRAWTIDVLMRRGVEKEERRERLAATTYMLVDVLRGGGLAGDAGWLAVPRSEAGNLQHVGNFFRVGTMPAPGRGEPAYLVARGGTVKSLSLPRV